MPRASVIGDDQADATSKSAPFDLGAEMAFTPKNDGFGYATTRPGASSMSAAMQGGNMSSEEEDEDEDAEAAD